MIKGLLLLAVAFSLLLVTPGKVDAQSCAAPVVATGVAIEYPGCNGASCDLLQAGCEWNSQADAASFNITVTEVDTSTIIKNNESQSSTTTKVIFPITQGRTYKCDVVAVSSCGGLAAAASDQLLCPADAILDTPTPTQVVVPTATSMPPTAKPTIASPGGFMQSITIIGGLVIVIIGGFLLFAL